ncbi:peptidase [Thioclava sp. GXIMD2076]|uniref:peptidase n=1 Tax=Thioclava sp. GXIMD2076 TaxID=3131931 RepID=UPI0030CF34FF
MNSSSELRLAIGQQLYRIESPFGALPADTGTVSDVAGAPDGSICLLTRRDPRVSAPADCVHVLDRDGALLRSWGAGRITDAHKIAIDPQSRVWVVDRDAHEVVVFDMQGQELMAIGQRHGPGQPFNHPTDVAFLSDGGFVVTDGYAGAQVHVFGPEGERIRAFGSLGRPPGQFIVPHGVAVLSGDRIVVADRENDRVQIFSREGEVLGVFDVFCRPMDVFVDAQDTIFVTDAIPTLTRINDRGEVLGRGRGSLNGPHGFSEGRSGEILLAETNPSRLSRLIPLRA